MKINYNDAWILSNWEKYKNWNTLCNVYNETFGTSIKYKTFKSHCNTVLQLNFMYTKEQEKWLIVNYPILGKNKCTEEFNKKFGTNRTKEGIRLHCVRLGLHVTKERIRMRATENAGNSHDVGTILPRARGELYIKKEDGKWESLSRHLIGEDVPKDCVVVFLDRNNRNFERENLAVVPRRHMGTMSKNKFWSEDAEITKAGLVWCKLYEVLKVKQDEDER